MVGADEPEAPPREGWTDFRRPVRHLFDPAPAEKRSRGTPAPLLVALHGQGMSAASFRRVLRHLPPTGHARLFPEGPHPFEVREGEKIRSGHAWYIFLGDQAAFRSEMERTEEHLLALLDRVDAEHGPFDRGRSVLLGFSQGGYLASFVGARHPERFAGVVIAAARLKHEFLSPELAGGALPRFLLLHSAEDAAMPFARAEESRDRLAAAGTRVDLRPFAGGHRLPPEALAELARWLEENGLAAAPAKDAAPGRMAK
jgi:predicted esterase